MSTEVQIHEKLPLTRAIPLGLRHVFAMFDTTVLVSLKPGVYYDKTSISIIPTVSDSIAS